MKLYIDNRELDSRMESAIRFFQDDYTIETGSYPVGDYIFNERVVFEYKSADDMINSIMDGRIFRQVEKMKQYPFHYVIIVGDVAGTINERNQNYWNRYLGTLARLNIETHVLNVDNNQQAWNVMKFLVEKLLKDNPNVKGVERPRAIFSDPVASFLSSIYVNDSQRLGIKTAVTIREYLHLESLSDLLDVTYDDLVGIKGVGKKTAKAVMEALN